MFTEEGMGVVSQTEPTEPGVHGARGGATLGQAWEPLYAQGQAAVLRAAYRITGSLADAEDVLQTVFVRLLRRGPEAEPIADPEAYLRRAAVHAALDLLRRREAERWVPLEEVAAPPAAAPDAELARALRLALARLSPRAAVVFALRHFEGLNHGEIAAQAGLSRAHTAVILHRAQRQLRRALARFAKGGGRP
ncbi:MAG: RNA polymerase sigma factor [Terriglobales bacterium]